MVHDTPPSQDTFPQQTWNSYLKEYRRYASDSKQFLETRSEVKINATGTLLVRDPLSSQDASTYQIWDSYLK